MQQASGFFVLKEIKRSYFDELQATESDDLKVYFHNYQTNTSPACSSLINKKIKLLLACKSPIN